MNKPLRAGIGRPPFAALVAIALMLALGAPLALIPGKAAAQVAHVQEVCGIESATLAALAAV